MGEVEEYENLMLAAMVHDIGKFWQGKGRRLPYNNTSVASKLSMILVCSNWHSGASKNDP